MTQRPAPILELQGVSKRFVKPLDEMLLHEVFSKFDKVITVEDGCLMGGFGSAVLEFMSDRGYKAEVVRLGIPDEYIHHGTQEELWADCGFDKNAIVSAVKKALSISSFEKKHTEKVS